MTPSFRSFKNSPNWTIFGIFNELLSIECFCRFILDTFFYCLFLGFILHSVLDGIGNSKNEEKTWSLCYVALWVFGYILRDLKNMVRSVQGDKNLVSFRFGYDLTLHILLSIAIVFKVSVMNKYVSSLLCNFHPVNIFLYHIMCIVW